MPTHYHMTLNLGTTGVRLTPTSQRFVFVWDEKDQASVAITIGPPPTENTTYMISIRTWDLKSGDAARDGKVYVRFTGDLGISEQIQVLGNFKRGEIETQSFVRKPLGKITSVMVEYNDGQENNAWALNYVELKDMRTQQIWHCAANSWMGNQSQQTKSFPCALQR